MKDCTGTSSCSKGTKKKTSHRNLEHTGKCVKKMRWYQKSERLESWYRQPTRSSIPGTWYSSVKVSSFTLAVRREIRAVEVREERNRYAYLRYEKRSIFARRFRTRPGHKNKNTKSLNCQLSIEPFGCTCTCNCDTLL